MLQAIQSPPSHTHSQSRTFNMGTRDMELGGKYLGTLRESTHLLSDVPALQRRMKEDGYLFLRGVQPREKVLAARQTLVEYLDSKNLLDRSHPLLDAVMADPGKGAYLGGTSGITHTPALTSLFESPEILGFFNRFLGKAALTFNYKWLRVVAGGETTPAHYDVVFMGRGTCNLYTCWSVLGDTPMEQGPLAVLHGSHCLESYRKIKETYGKADVDRDNINSNFSNDPMEIVDRYGGQWHSGDFQMGDVLIFSMLTMHGSLKNKTDRYRISADTRFQPADEPVDERWAGKDSMGNYAWKKTPPKTIEESRKEWGV